MAAMAAVVLVLTETVAAGSLGSSAVLSLRMVDSIWEIL